MVVVSVSPQIQRERVLARPGMTAQMLDTILAKQLPDAQKRQRADYLVMTDTMDDARAQVAGILTEIRKGLHNA